MVLKQTFFDSNEKKHAKTYMSPDNQLGVENKTPLSAIAGAIRVGLAVVDEAHRYRYTNEHYIAMLNLPAGAIIGQRMDDLHPDLYAEQIRPCLEKAFRGERIEQELKLPALAPSTEERHCTVSCEPDITPSEKTVLIALVDITDRKKAEEWLKSVARFPWKNPNPVLRVDAMGVLLYANNTSHRLLRGWDLEIGKAAPQRLQQAAAEAAICRTTIHFDSEHNQRIFSFSVVPCDEADYVDFYAQEVTASRKLEEELRQQAMLLDLAPVLVRDMTNRIAFWGRGAQQLYGYSKEEAIGRNCAELLRTEFPISFAEIVQTLKHRGLWERELIRRKRDGSRIVVASRWVLYHDTKGEPTHLLEADTDITLRKVAEENVRKWTTQLEEVVMERTANLRAAKEQAERADRAKSDFLANMSHELRTPLNAIIGFSQLLIDGRAGPLNPEQREYLSDVLASGSHLLNLLSDILDVTKISAGRLELNPQPFSITQAIEQSCATAQAMASKKNIRITTNTPVEGDVVCLDRVRFMQVLQNLISNAVKFTPENGAVNVTILFDEQRRIRLQVKDTGIGIGKKDLPRLFHEFEQFDSGFAKRQQGTGLGLALTKKIIELQQGSITVESEPEQGSTFTVILPLKQGAAVKPETVPA